LGWPLGVKGAGEAGTVGTMPAVTNALIDALAEFGVREIEMPATPERIWRAMQRRPAPPDLGSKASSGKR
jgi:aerobic carbon-monoxide dehydrogenase large subunit